MVLSKAIKTIITILNIIIPIIIMIVLFSSAYRTKEHFPSLQESPSQLQTLVQGQAQTQGQTRLKNEESLKTLPELKHYFNPSNNGYFQIGGFLMQWGLAQGGTAGKNVQSRGQNPVMTWGIGVAVGITLDMMEEREAWDTGVSMNRNFDEIYGAQVIPYGNKDRKIYENIKVKELNPDRIVVRTGNYHAPFFWFAYGLRIRNDEESENNNNDLGISTDFTSPF